MTDFNGALKNGSVLTLHGGGEVKVTELNFYDCIIVRTDNHEGSRRMKVRLYWLHNNATLVRP